MTSDMYTNFNGIITSLGEDNKNILKKIEELRQTLKDGNENTGNLESQIEKDIANFKKTYSDLENGYSNRNAPPIPSAELDRRQKEIQNLNITLTSLNNAFKETTNLKYSYKVNDRFKGEYKQTEEMKNMSNSELLAYQKDKIKQQDNQIDDITLEVKKGRVLATEAKHQIQDQDKQLDALQEDVDKLDSKMNRVTKKFENYVIQQSTCKIIIILVIEVAIAVLVLMLLN